MNVNNYRKLNIIARNVRRIAPAGYYLLGFQTAYSWLLFSNTYPGRHSESDQRTPTERYRLSK